MAGNVLSAAALLGCTLFPGGPPQRTQASCLPCLPGLVEAAVRSPRRRSRAPLRASPRSAGRTRTTRWMSAMKDCDHAARYPPSPPSSAHCPRSLANAVPGTVAFVGGGCGRGRHRWWSSGKRGDRRLSLRRSPWEACRPLTIHGRAGPGRRCSALQRGPVAAATSPGSGLAGSGLARVARQRHPRQRAARLRDGRHRPGGAEGPRRDRRVVAARDAGQADVRTCGR